MKQITIIGYLGEDAKAEQKENYVSLLLKVAVSEVRKDNKGEKQSFTDWFSCYDTYHTMPKILEYLKKGQRIAITGNISFKQVKLENGNVYFNKNINVDRMEILFNKKTSEL